MTGIQSYTWRAERVGVRVDPFSERFDAELGGLNIIDDHLNLDVVRALSHCLVEQQEHRRRLLTVQCRMSYDESSISEHCLIS